MFGERGRSFGKALGHAFTGITGMGDYKISQNSLLRAKDSVAAMKRHGDGIEISHREYLFDLQGSTTFARTDLELNPGLPSTCPWLSQLAAYFEEYKFLGVAFEFISTSGQVTSVSPALGSVVMSTEYDVTSVPYQTKQQAESAIFVTSGIPCQNMIHPLECKNNLTNKLLVREGTVSDKRWYDIARTSIVTQGMPSQYTVGEIWITYHVKLCKPRINACKPGDWMWFKGDVSVSGGSITYVRGNTKFAKCIASANSLRFFFPHVGKYHVTVAWNNPGADWTYTNMIWTADGNIKLLPTLYGLVGTSGSNLVTNGANASESIHLTKPTFSASYDPATYGTMSDMYIEVTEEEEIVDGNYIEAVGFDGSTNPSVFYANISCCNSSLGKLNIDLS